MAFYNAIPISKKLPLIIAGLCLSACLSVAFVSYADFKRNIMQQTRDNFTLLASSRGADLTAWFDDIESNVASLGTDPSVISAANGFVSTYNLMIDSAGLQAAYITNNPHPPAERDKLDKPPEQVPYHFQHAQFHPFFREIKNSEGFYDVFLFNLDGDLIYSVFKEADFATDFRTGPFADSGLAKVFDQARNGTKGEVFFSDFERYAPSGGAAASFLATPVVDQSGVTLGVAAVQIPKERLNEILNNASGLGDTGELYLIGPDLRTRSASRFADGFEFLTDTSALPHARADLQDQVFIAQDVTGITGAAVFAKSSSVDVFGQTWRIVAEMELSEVTAPTIAVRNKMIVLVLGVVLISSLLGWLIARSFVRPLERLSKAVQLVMDKDFGAEFPDRSRRDELGKLSETLVQLRDTLAASDLAEEERRTLQAEQVRVVGRLSSALDDLAKGDLTHQITTPFLGDYDQLRQNYNKAVATFSDTLGSVVERAKDIRSRAHGMSTASDDLSRRTENQAATLEETAAALDELTASVKSAAEGARKVETVVSDARKDAQASEPVVQNAVNAMHEIKGSSDEISKIIGVIDDIAFQTNLLALNAGVEAARAGEAGRGFAVVASEVRALAQRSSDAARQIKTLIAESAGQVSQGVDLVGQAGSVLTKIAGHVGHISELMSDIAAGAEEQSVGLGEINIGVTQLDKVTQQNASMVEQQTANSHALNENAGELGQLMERFRMEGAKARARHVSDNIDAFQPKMVQSANTAIPKPVRAPVVQGATAEKLQDDMWQDF